jgi:hypothetical protein
MAVDRSWQSRDGKWLVDQVVREPGVSFRVWDNGELVAELGDWATLERWLRGAGVDWANMLPADDEDRFCE